MNFDFPILSLLLFLPLAGALLVSAFWRSPAAARWVALAVSVAELALAAWAGMASCAPASGAPAGYFLYQDLPWIERFGIRYLIGMDGISLVLTLLTAVIALVAVVVSWNAVQERVALYFALLLAVQTGTLGVFFSLDLFLFYLFWEAMLIPMFFLVGIWGNGNKLHSAVKFFLYTFVGSLLMLVAIISLYLMHGAQTGSYSFSLFELTRTSVPYGSGLWLFAGFLVALAVKFPLFPLHTWLPDTYCDAPAAGTLVLSSVLAKTAAYALLRFAFPLLPEAARAFTPLIYTAAVVGILYGAWVALAQTDLKRLIAYSSLSHMGFVALGIAAWTPVALSGAVLQMVNHGITTGALFVLVGLLDERTANREIAGYGGVWGTAPVLAFFFLLFNMASAGVPGLNNFVSEFMILVGTFRVAPAAAIGAFLGSVLTLIYTVRLVQGMLFGAERSASCIADLSLREVALLSGLALLVVYLGVHPAPVLDTIKTPLMLLAGGR